MNSHQTSKEPTLTRQHTVRIDLGCGSNKPVGFIGADRLIGLPGVDLIFDLNQPLPFANNSADLVLASHSLEHAVDLMATMKEIYRISKPGAQICIVAPYSQQSLNYANPYHQQTFNEHTPRFWTASPLTTVDLQEYYHPHAADWGLSESDHSSPGFDFRCINIEFFYFPEYRRLSSEEQRAARKKYLDVCDQIMYHLIVAKPPLLEEEIQAIIANVDLYEPPQVTVRKVQELLQIWKESGNIPDSRLSENVNLAPTEVEQGIKPHEIDQPSFATLNRIPDLLIAQAAVIKDLRNMLHLYKNNFADQLELSKENIVRSFKAQEDELVRIFQTCEVELGQVLRDREEELTQAFQKKEIELTQALQTLEAELAQVRSRETSLAQSLASTEAELAQVRSREATFSQSLASTEAELQHILYKSTSLQRRKIYRWLDVLTNRFSRYNAWDDVDPAFRQLKDDSLIFSDNLRGFGLRPSPNLQNIPFLAYPLRLNRPGLTGLALAVAFDIHNPGDGRLGIEIVSPDNQIVAQLVVPVGQVTEIAPVCFDFEPLYRSGPFLAARLCPGCDSPYPGV